MVGADPLSAGKNSKQNANRAALFNLLSNKNRFHVYLYYCCSLSSCLSFSSFQWQCQNHDSFLYWHGVKQETRSGTNTAIGTATGTGTSTSETIC